MDKLNKRIINKYIFNLIEFKYSEVEIASISYFMEIILSEIEKILIILVMFTILGKFNELVIFLISIGSLRIFIGGFHLKTFNSCLAFTTIYFSIAIYVLLRIHFSDIMIQLCYIFSLINIIIFAPIQSKNRIQFSKNERNIIKIKAIVVLVALFIISTINVKLQKYIMLGLTLQQVEIIMVKILEWRRKRIWSIKFLKNQVKC